MVGMLDNFVAFLREHINQVLYIILAAPQAVVVTTSNGIAGVENPGYAQAYAPVISK